MSLQPGMTLEVKYTAGPGTLASDMGNPGVEVLGTPTIFRWVEDVTTRLITPFLAPSQATVGSWVSLRHLAATPAGMPVRAQATLREVHGRRLRFGVELFDTHEKIAEAEHERVIVDLGRFLGRVERKKSRVPGPRSSPDNSRTSS